MRHSNAKCSFCLKAFKDVGPVVEGPESVYICADCIDLCQSVIEQEERRRNPPPESSVHERLHHAFAHVFRPVPETTAPLLVPFQVNEFLGFPMPLCDAS
jgi:ATP-dependent protease Clp ATPase subunit